ncbi:hypothetical protein WR25_12935 [Diploscapter pachys]|uniref:Uncharacterized protein n=1 Tax=Diploscapter pachys TaxID=2018661 RepID=A0A2A2LXK3_9BILA|nr:hypothetical protein WR25_12935 [Diploscapter pachys]
MQNAVHFKHFLARALEFIFTVFFVFLFFSFVIELERQVCVGWWSSLGCGMIPCFGVQRFAAVLLHLTVTSDDIKARFGESGQRLDLVTTLGNLFATLTLADTCDFFWFYLTMQDCRFIVVQPLATSERTITND